jgi:transposase InsO family protein
MKRAVIEFIPWVSEHSCGSQRSLCRRLGLTWSRYQRWNRQASQGGDLADVAGGARERLDSPLPWEVSAVADYALDRPDAGYRRLTWEMVDRDIAHLSESAVYRILSEEDLLYRWARPSSSGNKPPPATEPNQRWHTDIMHIRIGDVWYFLVSFLDAYSRFIVHWELLPTMKKEDVSLALLAALEKHPGATPEIVSDHGCQYTSKEFRKLVARFELNHILCRIAHPQSNGTIERYHRSTREAMAVTPPRNLSRARELIGEWVKEYNENRLHAGLKYIEPAEYFRGNPADRIASRRSKLDAARQNRIATNAVRRAESELPTASVSAPTSLVPILAETETMDNSRPVTGAGSPNQKTVLGLI